jgi:hypothetical protein
MKYITSTTGSKITFNINANRKIVIDTIVPVQVEDSEFVLLDSRLGSALKLVDINAPAKMNKIDKKEEEDDEDTDSTLKKGEENTEAKFSEEDTEEDTL